MLYSLSKAKFQNRMTSRMIYISVIRFTLRTPWYNSKQNLLFKQIFNNSRNIISKVEWKMEKKTTNLYISRVHITYTALHYNFLLKNYSTFEMCSNRKTEIFKLLDMLHWICEMTCFHIIILFTSINDNNETRWLLNISCFSSFFFLFLRFYNILILMQWILFRCDYYFCFGYL